MRGIAANPGVLRKWPIPQSNVVWTEFVLVYLVDVRVPRQVMAVARYICQLNGHIGAQLSLDAQVPLVRAANRRLVRVIVDSLPIEFARIRGCRDVRKVRSGRGEEHYRRDAVCLVRSVPLLAESSAHTSSVSVEAPVI